MEYDNYQRNHVIIKGREEELEKFLNATMKGTGIKHKLQHHTNSNSEDALTWSCFDTLRSYKPENIVSALNEILEDSFENDKLKDSFENNKPFDFHNEKNIKIEIGKEYAAPTLIINNKKNEATEVDASIETDDKLLFFEAKLYSSMGLKNEEKNQPHNQIANKLRIGLDYARNNKKKFYFIFLDIAPLKQISELKSKRPRKSIKEAEEEGSSFAYKWKSAWWFKYYKGGKNNSIKPLREILKDITSSEEEITQVRQNMGWLTWASLFKTTLRAVIK